MPTKQTKSETTKFTKTHKNEKVVKVEEYNEVMKSEIAVTRRTTYRAEESVANLEK
jgi:hypothetical protein